MAYDILRGNVTARDWSRGGGQNIGTVGATLGGQDLSKKLIAGALVGAVAAVSYLVWRGHHGHRPAYVNPMSRRVIYERTKSGRLVKRL